MTKVLLTHDLFPPDSVGGGELLNYRIAKELIKRGYSVKVLTTGNTRIKKYDNIETIRIPINRYLMNLAIPNFLYHAKNADIIQTSSGNACFPSWVAAKVLKKPICCYVHHILGKYWGDVKGVFLGKIFESTEKLFLNRSYDAFIFQNKSSKKIGIGIGIDENRIFLLQPGIDYQNFQIKGIKKEPLVLFVGNLSMNKTMVKTKGLEYLLEAAKILHDVKFVIVGEGNYLSSLEKTSPPNVMFTGGLVGKPLIKLYNKALIFCLPSLAEGFGLTILEAMASGCAIVSTIDIGQEGIIIKQKSAKDIVKAVSYLVQNPSVPKKIGKRNRKLAKKFTWDRFMKGLIRIYDYIR